MATSLTRDGHTDGGDIHMIGTYTSDSLQSPPLAVSAHVPLAVFFFAPFDEFDIICNSLPFFFSLFLYFIPWPFGQYPIQCIYCYK